MNILIKRSLTNNKILKIVSLTLGLATWALLSHYQTVTKWVEVPVCFYNVPSHMNVCCNQDKINIQVRGKSSDICQCKDLGLHVDAAHFKPGIQRIHPSTKQLFLPNSVKLVHNKPLYLEITTTINS